MKSVTGQMYADIKNVQHDIFLIYLIPIPVFLALIFPFTFNQVGILVGEYLDIMPYFKLITTYVFLILPSLLWGTIFGFLIVNEKDLRTLDAIMVTPNGLRRLINFRVVTGSILSGTTSILTFQIMRFDLSLELIYQVLLSSIFAPIMMLLIASIPKNKVQAFAIMKATSSFFVLPFFYLLVPFLEILFYIIPSYWIAKPLLNEYFSNETDWRFYLLAMISQFVWISLAKRFFQKKIT